MRLNSFQGISSRYRNNRKMDESILVDWSIDGVLGRIVVLASSGVGTPLILHCLTLKMGALEPFIIPVTIMGQHGLHLRCPESSALQLRTSILLERWALLDPITILTLVTHVIPPLYVLLGLYYWLIQYFS